MVEREMVWLSVVVLRTTDVRRCVRIICFLFTRLCTRMRMVLRSRYGIIPYTVVRDVPESRPTVPVLRTVVPGSTNVVP